MTQANSSFTLNSRKMPLCMRFVRIQLLYKRKDKFWKVELKFWRREPTICLHIGNGKIASTTTLHLIRSSIMRLSLRDKDSL